MKTYLGYYLILINILSVIVTIVDKQKAIKHKWRISENSLLMFGILGGSLVMLITMLFIRHKTKHLKFMLGLPLIFVFQLFAFALIKIYL